jgi:hypothetical protein
MTIPALSILAIALLVFLVIQGLKGIWRRRREDGALSKLLVNAGLNLFAAFLAFGGFVYLKTNTP